MHQPAIYLTHRPAPPLDRYVEMMWYWVGDPPTHAKDRLLPTGSASLVINLDEDEIRDYQGDDDAVMRRFPGAVLVGAHSRYSVIDSREQRAVLGVSFRPGGMWPFFDPAADELHNQQVSMQDVWGTSGATLRERILARPTPRERLELLERELLAQAIRPLQRRAEIDFALARLTRSPQDSIALLSQHVGLGERRFTRLFTLEVGLTPKLYARIKRFQRALKLAQLPAQPGKSHALSRTDAARAAERFRPDKQDWSDLAQRCGYFDQSHLIRDCRAMSGFTPAQLVLRRSGNTNHVSI